MPYSETTSTGWFSRIGNSFGGIAVGLVLLVAATCLLYWNEGRTVKTRGAINEAQQACVEMKDITKVDPAFDGKLVHATGKAETTEVLSDAAFGVKTPGPAIKLSRAAEFYQWVESSKSETRKKFGGGTETVTTYSYDKQWVSQPVDSSEFHDPEYQGKNTVRANAEDMTVIAQNVTFGAYTLPDFLKSSISGAEPLKIALSAEQMASINKQLGGAAQQTQQPNGGIPDPISVKTAEPAQAPAATAQSADSQAKSPDTSPVLTDLGNVHVSGSTIYLGAAPASPAIGDVRLSYSQVVPGDVSLVAKVIGSTFEVFTASNGKSFSSLTMGTKSADNMFSGAKSSNKVTAWIFRIIGIVLVIIGFNMLLGPLSVIADVIPFLGSIVGAGTGFVAFLLGLAWSLIVIAVSWIRFRPVLAFSLIGAAVVVLVLIIIKGHKNKPAAA
jgi:hypothetical protein